VDTQGHGEAANQVQKDTGGPARILKDTPLEEGLTLAEQ